MLCYFLCGLFVSHIPQPYQDGGQVACFIYVSGTPIDERIRVFPITITLPSGYQGGTPRAKAAPRFDGRGAAVRATQNMVDLVARRRAQQGDRGIFSPHPGPWMVPHYSPLARFGLSRGCHTVARPGPPGLHGKTIKSVEHTGGQGMSVGMVVRAGRRKLDAQREATNKPRRVKKSKSPKSQIPRKFWSRRARREWCLN